MKRISWLIGWGLYAMSILTTTAAVPHVISYQGRVMGGGTNFHGVGHFKFALVGRPVDEAATATATATVMYGFLVDITVVNPGSGYTTAPAVSVSDPTGAGAVARASISNGSVVSIAVLNAGFAYSASPSVVVAPPSADTTTTYWSNDGSSDIGDEPDNAVSIQVENGLFTILLGDTNIIGMSPIPYTAFEQSKIYLRIWFGDGVRPFSMLVPDQRITAVAYAMMAAQVPDGSVTDAKLADGAVTPAKLSQEATSALGASSGTVVMSKNPSDTNLLQAGYVKVEGVSPRRNSGGRSRPPQGRRHEKMLLVSGPIENS